MKKMNTRGFAKDSFTSLLRLPTQRIERITRSKYSYNRLYFHDVWYVLDDRLYPFQFAILPTP